MRLSGTTEMRVEGDALFPVNKGALCIKGWTAAVPLQHPERLSMPLLRDAAGQLRPASWEVALEHIGTRVRQVQASHGHDAVGVFGSGSLTNEKAYLLGKFARVGLRTRNIDYNGRFCMSSAAAAGNKAFGLDRGLPFPLEDIATAEVILLAGGNVAETMPPIMQYFEAQRAKGGQLIVIDPRQSATARGASLHLKLTPGTDCALANGLLHLLIREGLIDSAYIEARTEGFAAVRQLVSTYWPDRVERITGIPEAQLLQAARLLGKAKTAMVLTGRGPEQQSQGVNNVSAYINIALALGQVGKRSGGYGCLTGQGNGQGGREQGQKADQLPGYRRIDSPEARQFLADVWGIPESELPGVGRSAYELLDCLGTEDGVKALFVFGSNVVVSAPNAVHVEERLRALDLLVVVDFFLSETAQLADVVLPAAQWAEEEGTMTNLEGRVVHRRKALEPPGGVRTDLEIICAIAERLGKGAHFKLTTAYAVFGELRRATAGGLADYAGITYEKIDANDGVFWPCPSVEHPGTPRLFTEHFPTPSGKARFAAVRHLLPAETPDEEFPLHLTTGRLLAQYQSGTQTRRVEELQQMAPAPLAEVHPATARRYGLQEGAPVTMASRRGQAQFVVKLAPGIRQDTVFVPFHWGGQQAVNRLTNAALDPTSRMPEFKVCAVRIVAAAQSSPAARGGGLGETE